MGLAESRARRGVIWTGSNDGQVYVTRDSGVSWANVSPPLPPAAAWGSVKHVEPSRYDAATAYITVDAHQEGNFAPWVFRTKDFGRTWDLIVSGIQESPLSYAHIIREDPVRRGLLYLGTENALYVSFDDGDRWQQFNNNLPPAPVYGLVIQENFNDLVIGTYGRGFWILDDLGPLQRLTPSVLAANAHLFAPRPAYRWRQIPGNYSVGDDMSAGQNPPYGAGINYWVKTAPANPVRIEILDSTRKVLRTMRDSATAGLNRVYWDLRNDTTRSARLRTKPLYNAEFPLGPDGTRNTPGFNNMTVVMPPGRYTVRLTVDGAVQSQPLELRQDPHSRAPLPETRANVNALLAIQRDNAAVAGMINTIESVRSQLQSLRVQFGAEAAAADVRSAGDSLERKFMDVEQRIVDLRMTGRGQDEVRWPARLAAQLAWLFNGIAASDFAPTTQHREVAALLAKETRDTHAALQALIAKDLANYNSLLRSRGLKTIDVELVAIAF
jgi:hypothetical protein